MNRLTMYDEFGNADIIALADDMPAVYEGLSFSEMNALTKAINKLAAYEDSEEQGTLFPRWIPVTARLPEKRKWVLCRCEAGITDVLRYENAEWYHDPTHVYFFDFVTHWMPIPAPPEEEET